MMRAEISILMENPADVLSDREGDEGKIVKSAARRCSCLPRLYPALSSLGILFGYYLSTTQSTGAPLMRQQKHFYRTEIWRSCGNVDRSPASGTDAETAVAAGARKARGKDSAARTADDEARAGTMVRRAMARGRHERGPADHMYSSNMIDTGAWSLEYRLSGIIRFTVSLRISSSQLSAQQNARSARFGTSLPRWTSHVRGSPITETLLKPFTPAFVDVTRVSTWTRSPRQPE